jgi:hypothetical protein
VENVDCLPIQETKMEEIYKSFCRMLWGNSNYAWAFHSSLGNNIETLYIWNKVKAKKILFTFIGKGCVGV